MKKWTPTQNTAKARFYHSLVAFRDEWQDDSWARTNDARGLRFISDMVSRMENNKGLSTKQKTFAQNLIDAGVPSKPDCPEADELEALIPFINQRGGDIISEMAGKIRKGWKLSEKQRKFLDSLVAEAKENQTNPFTPSAEDIEDMRLIVKCASLYDSMYWGSHQRLGSYVNNIKNYLQQLDIPNPHQPALPLITRVDIDKGLEAVKGKVKQLKEPRVMEGDLVYGRYWAGQALVCSEVDVMQIEGIGHRTYHNIAAEVLVDGVIRNIPVEQMSKRNVYKPSKNASLR